MKKTSRIRQAYANYQKKKTTKKKLLSRFMSVMPKIIFCTTKLEGEPVTKKMVNSLFK